MAFNLGGYAAAGGGADALQQMLAEAFKQQLERKRAAQDDTRIKIEQQKADDEKAYRMEAMRTAAENRAAAQKGANVATATKLAGDLTPGQTMDTAGASALRAGDLGSLLKHEVADLPSMAISGVSQATNAAPMMGRLQLAAAGRPERDTYLGTAPQQEKVKQDADLERLAADPSIPANIRGFLRIRSAVPSGAVPAELFKAEPKDKFMNVAPGGNLVNTETGESIFKSPAKPTPPALITIQTTDANGNAVTKVVPKTAGSEYVKPKGANAQLDNRLASAKTVNEVGSNIIEKLSDPKYAAVVGPAMGRAGTLEDWIGNPPPEFSELAGQIESYALANMGVHGMRSAQGAEAIKHLLKQHHTPESLAATIRGLNDFSTRFVKDNSPNSGSNATPATAAETPEQRLKRLIGGG